MEAYQVFYEAGQKYPMGVTLLEDGVHVSFYGNGEQIVFLVYRQGEAAPRFRVPFPEGNKIGNYRSMTIRGPDFLNMQYCFEVDNQLVEDPYGRFFEGPEIPEGSARRCLIQKEDFDWEGDRPLSYSYEQSIIYRIHPSGFTKHTSSGVKYKGTFQGIIEKIPYLTGLGITTLEIMPVIEFADETVSEYAAGNPYYPGRPRGRPNYWGYAPGLYFAPKASYSSGIYQSPGREFKTLVKALHKAGIELVIELYFTDRQSPVYIWDAVRFWVQEFHVDGIHLIGTGVLPDLLANDPYLADTKLWYSGWDQVSKTAHCNRNLGQYREDFQIAMRRLLKGDEDQLNGLVYHSKNKSSKYGIINYIAHTNGFTMMDMVSYDRKHNEANGEHNLDGTDYNYSWNCGVEGKTRRKKILSLRTKQIKNAIVLLMLSQGTPLLLAGDEFGNSQDGNNNAYCQDNQVSWLNWNLIEKNREIYEFVKYMIAFRRNHPVFTQQQLRVMDYKSCGYPDVSYHGVKAWCPQFENFRRELAMLYCGCYTSPEDDYFYVIYNMYWEKRKFDLPHLPACYRWYMAADTNDENGDRYSAGGPQLLISEKKTIEISPRTIVVLIGRK